MGGAESAGWEARAVEVRPGVRVEVVVDSVAGDSISEGYRRGEFSDDYRRLLTMVGLAIGPRGRVLDVGGHIGSFALAAAACGYEVVTVEASPRNAELLRLSAERNGFGNLRVVHAAVAERSGSLEFLAAGPFGHVATGHAAAVKVPARRLDDILDEVGWGQPDFVKMDVEGSEVAAIRGMGRRLSRADAPALHFESNRHTLHFFRFRPVDLLAEVAGLGYRNFMIRGERLYPVASKHFQAATCVDYLALKSVPRSLSTAVSPEPVSRSETLREVVDAASHAEEVYRVAIARGLAEAPRDLRRNPEVRQALAKLREDPADEVRAAAAWDGRSLWRRLMEKGLRAG